IPVAHWRYEHDTLLPQQVYFTDLSYLEPAQWNWDFGDGSAMSQDTSPVHTLPGPGVYEVCLTVSNVNGSSTQCRQVSLTVGAQEAAAAEAIQVAISPSPFRHRLEVALGADLRRPLFRLYDYTGRLLRSAALRQGVTSVDTANLPAGVYFWEVLEGEARVRAGRVVKVE
ncbi:MAG: PKD domain-containing protein, partial [Saprospiraceae bacterium]|nr:PKD domain-containing protein [Saprospiraceae bacterium]